MDADKFLSEIWGGLKLFLDQKTQIAADERILAALLAADAENFDRFMALKEFQAILRSLDLKADVYSLQCAQLGAINAAKSAKISRSKLLAALKILQNENIIDEARFERLAAFLRELGANHDEKDERDSVNFKKSDVFHQKIDALNDICERILSLNPSADIVNMAKKARQKARELEFNVAVTGVINAGKSTLLNALLGKKILGSSNVPETVNLTVLKYASEPFAKVNFWSETELEGLGIAVEPQGEVARIYDEFREERAKFERAEQNLSPKKAGATDAEFNKNGDESEAKFSELENGKFSGNDAKASARTSQNETQESAQIYRAQNPSEIVKTGDIKRYTSADSPYAKFVKSVELYENLELLKDNVRIIDTPGIDDAVVLREELVRRFMSECDLMVHLMNVSQSATQKDVDFIVSGVKNSHVVKLAVLLTHTDLLSAEELNEVVSYAKKSINERLSGFGAEAEFFAVSAKSYFEGDKNSGVEEFKEYLYETLFGLGSQKSRLGIEAYKKELARVCAEFSASSQGQILRLTGSNLSLSQKFNELNEQKLALQISLEEVKRAVKEELEKLNIEASAASYELGLKSLSQTLKERITDDMNYASKKSGIDGERLSRIAQTTIKDGAINLMRQSRNEIVKQINLCARAVALRLGKESSPADEKIFNVNDYLTLKGVNLECGDACEKIKAAVNSGEKNIAQIAQEAAEEFLSGEGIRNFVFELVEFEKNKFEEEAQAALKDKEQAIVKNERNLKEELARVSQSSGESALEIGRLNLLNERINAINAELQDV